MIEMKMHDVPRFRRERDAALLTGDIHEVRKFAARWFKRVPQTSDRDATVAMHLAIVRADTLPLDYRLKSRAWLQERGVRP